jgi:Tfp pilus assembly protein PilE
MYKNNKGIALIPLIVVIVLIIILAAATVQVGSNVTRRSRIEDIKTNMLAIHGRAIISLERHSFQGGELLGEIADDDWSNRIGDIIMDRMQQRSHPELPNFRVITSAEMLSNVGLTHITINTDEFYIIDYSDNAEIYYSLGIDLPDGNRAFSLSDLQDV